MEECGELEWLARLARLEARREYCVDLARIRGFLAGLSRAKSLLEGVEPLYHVWEAGSRLGPGGSYPGRGVGWLPEGRVEEGYVVLPWRGRR